MSNYNKEVKDIIDHDTHRHEPQKPMKAAAMESKRPIPESARWHMAYRPYGIRGGQ